MIYTREQFIQKIKNDVINDAKKSNILPSLTIAQAILESGNGNSGLAVVGKALFGIKANSGWKGKVYISKTNEVYNGVSTTITAGFRAYNSWAESIQDHSNLFISLSRYKNLIGEKDYKTACKKVKEDGYATDPDYINKLINIIEKNKLYEFDKEIDKQENTTIKFSLFGNIPVDINGKIENGKSLVEARQLLEALNFKVSWNADTKTVLVNK